MDTGLRAWHDALPMLAFHGSEGLPARLATGGRKVVFLVGSALTMASAGRPGVAGVTGMIQLIRDRIAKPKGPLARSTR